MNIILQIGRMYSWNLLNSVKALIETSWSLSLVSPLFAEFGPGTHSVALLWYLEARSTTLFGLLLSSTNTFIEKTPSRENTMLSNTSFALLAFSCGRCIHSCLRIHYKDLLIRYNFELSHNSKFLETMTRHNSYGVVSTNLDGSLY